MIDVVFIENNKGKMILPPKTKNVQKNSRNYGGITPTFFFSRYNEKPETYKKRKKKNCLTSAEKDSRSLPFCNFELSKKGKNKKE